MGAGLHGQRPRKAPAVAVEHRQRPEIDRVLAHAGMDRVGVGHQRRAPVMIDHALRVARRAGRVVERDRVPFVVRHRPREIRVAAIDECLVVERPDALALRIGRVDGIVRIVIVDHQRLDYRQRQRLLHHAGKLAVDDQHLRLGMIELEGDDRSVEPRVQRMQHRLDHRHAEMRLQHRRRVGQHDGHGVALADALFRERRGELQRAPPEVAIGDAPAAMDDRDMIGKGFRGALQIGDRRQRLIIGGLPGEIGFIWRWHSASVLLSGEFPCFAGKGKRSGGHHFYPQCCCHTEAIFGNTSIHK